MLPTSGTLDVRLMGCQDLLEHVPGRSKAASVPLPGWSPSETRSSFISRANRNRGVSSRNLTKSEELSSELASAPAGMNEKWVVNNRVLNVQSIMICGRSSDEISAVLKLDNTVVGQTSWKPVSNQSWDQKFTLELDRVKHTHTHTHGVLLTRWCLLYILLYILCTSFVVQSRELEISVYWRDWRSLCAVKFLRLEDFLDNQRHGMCLYLEPQGMLFAEVRPPPPQIFLCVWFYSLFCQKTLQLQWTISSIFR